MFASDPWLPALFNESLFVLLGFVASRTAWFVMYVMLGITKDLLKASCRVVVDLQVVLIQSALPSLCVWIVDGVDPLSSRQGRISLALPEMWLIGWRIRVRWFLLMYM